MRIFDRFLCLITGHLYRKTDRISAGFLEMYHINECQFCGKEVIGAVLEDDQGKKNDMGAHPWMGD